MYQQQVSTATQSDSSHSRKLPRRGKHDFSGPDRQLRYLAGDLPFAVFSEEHGWGVVVQTPSRLPWWFTMHRAWYMVWYAHGLECRTIIPGEGSTRFFTWEAVREYIREKQESHLRRRQYYTSRKAWLHDWRPAWRLVYRMWG